MTGTIAAERVAAGAVARTPLSEGRSFGVLSPQICGMSNQDTKHAMILAGLGWGRLPLW